MSKYYQSDKTVVITDAKKGLGKACSLAFAGVGYEIIDLYRSDIVSAKEIKLEFQEKGFMDILSSKI